MKQTNVTSVKQEKSNLIWGQYMHVRYFVTSHGMLFTISENLITINRQSITLLDTLYQYYTVQYLISILRAKASHTWLADTTYLYHRYFKKQKHF
jgi:hypothetical protein